MPGLARPQLEVRFHPFFIAARGMEVGARRNAHGTLGILFNSEAGGNLCGDTTGIHNQLGVDRHVLGILATASARANTTDAVCTVLEGLGNGEFFFEASSRTLCALNQCVVKIHARASHSVSRK